MEVVFMALLRFFLPLLLLGPAFGESRGENFQFSLQDSTGATHSAAGLAHERATVFIFVATDCPNSNTYAPVLARLYREYSPRGIAFFNVYSDPWRPRPRVQKHDADFQTPFRALLDPHQTLARETGARSTPEVVILGPDGQELYRGRVDNRFVALGKTRYQPTENDLQEALDAILAGKPVPHPVTRTIGCAIPRNQLKRCQICDFRWQCSALVAFAGLRSAGDTEKPPAVPTFNHDIAPILYQNCSNCHRPGEVAPFALLTYQDAAKRAKQIAEITRLA